MHQEYFSGSNSSCDDPKHDFRDFNKLGFCTRTAFHSNSSLSSSGSFTEKNGFPRGRVYSKSSPHSGKRDNCDLGLISATTSPYRSEWENRNRPFCTRFYPAIDINASGTETNRQRLFIHNTASPTKRSEQFINLREAEKDRLAEIFALSPLRKKYNPDINKCDHAEVPNGLGDLLLNNANHKSIDNCNDSTLNNYKHDSSLDTADTIYLDKGVQTDESLYLQRDHLNKIEEYPVRERCANKEVQTYSDAESFTPDSIEERNFLRPEPHKNSILCCNDNNISSKFQPVASNKNDPLQFSPLDVNSSPNSDKRMVRIGEFSPLNPKLNSPGHAILGLGEYEERRKLLLEQRRHDYLEQVRLKAKNNEDMKKMCNQPLSSLEVKHVTTQTDCTNPTENLHREHVIHQDMTNSPNSHDFLNGNYETSGMNTVQIKQLLYREELRKQIEERQRIEAEKKEKEKIEEEVMECKIKQQQQEMEKKYEAELAERMQLAQKKKEQEEALHHRLLEMQKQTMLDKKQNWQNRKEIATCSRINDCQQTDITTPVTLRSSPFKFSENTPLHSYRKEREKMPKEISNENKSSLQQSTKQLTSPIDELVFTANTSKKTNLKETSPHNRRFEKDSKKKHAFTVLSSVSDDPIARIAQQRAEAEEILRRPLIDSDEPYPTTVTSASTSQHDTVRRLTFPDRDNDMEESTLSIPRSSSPPIPAIKNRARTNSEALEDKWQVPVVEKFVMTPMDIHSQNNNRVLTQLGAFRKHLQQEQMRLSQELKSTKLKPS